MIERILQGTGHTLSVTLYSDATPVDPSPDSATVRVVRENGTELVATTAATNAGTGVFTYALTPTQTASLDVLTAYWTFTVGGAAETRQTLHEVAGGFLFTLAEARNVKPLDNTTTYTTAELIAGRTLAEAALEDACGLSFVPRYFREKVDGNGSGDVLLSKPRPLTITAATVGGTALSAGDLAALELYRDGRVYNPNGWTEGRRNVVLTGTAGYPFPPPRVGRACLLLAKRFLVESSVSDRATAIANAETGTTQFFVTAGVREMVFDVPECNAITQEYGVRGAG